MTSISDMNVTELKTLIDSLADEAEAMIRAALDGRGTINLHRDQSWSEATYIEASAEDEDGDFIVDPFEIRIAAHSRFHQPRSVHPDAAFSIDISRHQHGDHFSRADTLEEIAGYVARWVA